MDRLRIEALKSTARESLKAAFWLLVLMGIAIALSVFLTYVDKRDAEYLAGQKEIEKACLAAGGFPIWSPSGSRVERCER